VKESLNRIGGVDIEVLPVFPSPKPYGYRSKLTPHFQTGKDGEIGAIGFLRQGSRRAILDVPQCPIATEGINSALTDARQNLRSTWKRKKGGTLLLRDTQEGVTTDSQAIVSETVNDLVFQFKAGEFFQNNSFLLPEMVSYVVSEAKGDGLECLVDAYCGGGLFALSAAQSFPRVMGVEISRDGFDWARANAVVNRIENCEFLLGNASEIFAELNISGESCSLVVDPPRKGCGDDFLRQALAFGPARIIYVSCDPSTQARDSQYLIEGGYVIVKAQPFDLFPQTRHVENVLTFVKESPSSHEANL
jgi:23S rRNA (uracil1939-C5)-methyltransferase/tRNA (uracil-5-)-methyltransferase